MKYIENKISVKITDSMHLKEFNLMCEIINVKGNNMFKLKNYN